jgi:hypothetical protein
MLNFDGAIAGMGTESGTRLVVGMWPLSPYGSVTDVMIERGDGHRILLAPTKELADFIAGTYQFDEVRVTPVLRVRDGKKWMVSTAARRWVGCSSACRGGWPGRAGGPPRLTRLPGWRWTGSGPAARPAAGAGSGIQHRTCIGSSRSAPGSTASISANCAR